MMVSNWFCPKCKKTVASDEITESRRHKVCKEKVEWQRRHVRTVSSVVQEEPDTT